MKRIKEDKKPRWAASFKPRDKRTKPKYAKPCARCGADMIGTKQKMRATTFCSISCAAVPLGERWENLFEEHGDCWRWKGTTNSDGYGLIRDNNKMVLAHRVALRLKLGVDSFKGLACHTCDNRWCVNPDHLYVGTHEENMRDMAIANSGSGSKTSWADRTSMAQLYHAGCDAADLAVTFGVTTKTVLVWAKRLGATGEPPTRQSPGASSV